MVNFSEALTLPPNVCRTLIWFWSWDVPFPLFWIENTRLHIYYFLPINENVKIPIFAQIFFVTPVKNQKYVTVIFDPFLSQVLKLKLLFVNSFDPLLLNPNDITMWLRKSAASFGIPWLILWLPSNQYDSRLAKACKRQLIWGIFFDLYFS